MIEVQVELEVVAANFQRDLTPDERDPRPELQQKALDMRDQRRLDLVLLARVRGAEEI